MTLDVILKHKNARLPERATSSSAGYDLYAAEGLTIQPGEVGHINIGIVIGIPEGYEGQVRSRSGLAKKGIIVANSPGTIDADYRNDDNIVGVLLLNTTKEPYEVKVGDRVAQLVIQTFASPYVNRVESIPTLGFRGGFGSTGR